MRERLALSRQAEERAVAASDFLNGGWRACDAGFLYFRRGDVDQVPALANRVAQYGKECRVSFPKWLLPVACVGTVTTLQGDSQRLSMFTMVPSEAGNAQDGRTHREMGYSLNGLGDAERKSGESVSAEKHHTEALRIPRQLGDSEIEARALGALADLSLQQTNWPQPESFAQEALSLALNLARKELVANSAHHLAKNLAHGHRAVEVYTDLRSPEVEEALEILAEGG